MFLVPIWMEYENPQYTPKLDYKTDFITKKVRHPAGDWMEGCCYILEKNSWPIDV